MKKALLLSLALMALPALGHADSTSQLKQQLQRNYDSMNRALKRKDIPGTMTYYANDYTEINADGQEQVKDHATLVDHKKRLFRMTPVLKSKTFTSTDTIQSLAMVGPDAVVTVKSDYLRTELGKNGDVGKRHITETYRDFWTHSGGKWMIKRTRILDMNTVTTINGQVVNS